MTQHPRTGALRRDRHGMARRNTGLGVQNGVSFRAEPDPRPIAAAWSSACSTDPYPSRRDDRHPRRYRVGGVSSRSDPDARLTRLTRPAAGKLLFHARVLGDTLRVAVGPTRLSRGRGCGARSGVTRNSSPASTESICTWRRTDSSGTRNRCAARPGTRCRAAVAASTTSQPNSFAAAATVNPSAAGPAMASS